VEWLHAFKAHQANFYKRQENTTDKLIDRFVNLVREPWPPEAITLLIQTAKATSHPELNEIISTVIFLYQK
jgi:hypothetical protein